jgi:sulfate adenylyltransferase subunit 1
MSAHEYDHAHSSHGVLRFLTAGSVDDGKSTLIGRILYDSKAVLADQVQSLERAKHKRTEAGVLDLSLLTDGLEAEREQGITIDVAYRYFSTGSRKFIVADAPGHEQYTRNMVTAASTADAIVVLIDPTRVKIVDGVAELLPQTRRHSAIAGLLGIRHVIVAINKMDRMDFDEGVFNSIRDAYVELARRLSLPEAVFVPVSALEGDNVVEQSERMPWYRGPALLEHLERLPSGGAGVDGPCRFVVQRVQRVYGAETAAGSAVDGLRGLQGFVASGRLRVGDRMQVLPAGLAVTVRSISLYDTELAQATAGQSVTVMLNENVDASRGDVLASGTPPTSARQLVADICWLDTNAMNPSKKYWLKLGARTVQAKVQGVDNKLDLAEVQRVPHEQPFTLNEIGQLRIALAQPMPCTLFSEDAPLGRFILIDAFSNQTAAAGLIRAAS